MAEVVVASMVDVVVVSVVEVVVGIKSGNVQNITGRNISNKKELMLNRKAILTNHSLSNFEIFWSGRDSLWPC